MSDAYESYQFSVKRETQLERPTGSMRRSSFSSTPIHRGDSNSVGTASLSIALIGPDEERRRALVSALGGLQGGEVREFSSYPPALDNVPKMLERSYDVIIIDLDSDLEYALELVESICAEESATVMVYSAKADQELVFRCMRAGAREFLFQPFDAGTIAEALSRCSSAPRPGTRRVKKPRGRLLPFLGVKGGSGVTTIACNFAITLGQESGQSTLLIDLGLPLGDAALNLGIITEFSTDNAFQDVDRLDATFLSKLLVKHRSGISVLAAPSKVPKVQASNEAIDKLMNAARWEFENVIVDVGSRLDLMDTALFKEASAIYLVTQAGISELRNSNRVITQFFNMDSPKLEVVINRYDSNSLGLTDEHITKALNRPVQWKIPDDYAAARQVQNSTTSSSPADSSISRLIRQMARSSCGLPPIQEKTTGFRLRGLGKSNSGKIPTIDEPQATAATPVIDWPAPEPITYGTRLQPTQCHGIGSGNIRLHTRSGLLVAGGNPYDVGNLYADGWRGRRCGTGRRFDHRQQGNTGRQLANARGDLLRQRAQRQTSQCNGIGSGNAGLHPCCRRGAGPGETQARGNFHAGRLRELHHCADRSIGNGRQINSGNFMAHACTHSLRNPAQRRSAQRIGIGSRNLRLHASRGRSTQGWETHSFSGLQSGRYRRLHRGEGYGGGHRQQVGTGHCMADTCPNYLRDKAWQDSSRRQGISAGNVCLHS